MRVRQYKAISVTIHEVIIDTKGKKRKNKNADSKLYIGEVHNDRLESSRK